MEWIQEQHTTTREELKQFFMRMIRENGLENAIRWNVFAFEGKSKGTHVRGEIHANEFHVEISGWFEKLVAQRLRQSWQDYVAAEA